jgi:hypothetical protein
MLRISHCLDNQLTDGGEVVSPTHRPRSIPHKHYFSASGTHFHWFTKPLTEMSTRSRKVMFLGSRVRPAQLGRLGKLKKYISSSGLESVTLWVVA